MCGDGEVTGRESRSQEMLLPPEDSLPSCPGSGLQDGEEENVQLY